MRPSDALGRCVDPVAAGEFLAEHWERKPLVVERDEPARFLDLLSSADVERMLCGGGLRMPAFRLVKAGAQPPEAAYTTDLPWRPEPFAKTADPERVAAQFDGGATIVLQALHHNWPPLARFCRGLEVELAHGTQANAYYTPRASQGFAVHHDTHDVFVLQVEGEKRWLVYEPLLELPLKHQRHSKALGEPGPATMDFTLRAGDTLYLPRGWLHEALTSETDSLHITVGVNVHTWIDAMRTALDELEHDVDFRRSVPDDGEAPPGLVERLQARLAPEDVLRRRRRRLVETRRAVHDDALAQARAASALTAETVVERRETVLADLDGTTLVFEGKHVSFPAKAREALEAAAGAEEPFRALDLPGPLDADGRVVLVRRLVREGFLRCTGEEP